MDRFDIQDLLEQQQDDYVRYIQGVQSRLKRPIELKGDKKRMTVRLNDGKIKQICTDFIEKGRFHDNCSLMLSYKEYHATLYFQGNNRWGVDVDVDLHKNDFTVDSDDT